MAYEPTGSNQQTIESIGIDTAPMDVSAREGAAYVPADIRAREGAAYVVPADILESEGFEAINQVALTDADASARIWDNLNVPADILESDVFEAIDQVALTDADASAGIWDNLNVPADILAREGAALVPADILKSMGAEWDKGTPTYANLGTIAPADIQLEQMAEFGIDDPGVLQQIFSDPKIRQELTGSTTFTPAQKEEIFGAAAYYTFMPQGTTISYRDAMDATTPFVLEGMGMNAADAAKFTDVFSGSMAETGRWMVQNFSIMASLNEAAVQSAVWMQLRGNMSSAVDASNMDSFDSSWIKENGLELGMLLLSIVSGISQAKEAKKTREMVEERYNQEQWDRENPEAAGERQGLYEKGAKSAKTGGYTASTIDLTQLQTMSTKVKQYMNTKRCVY